MKEEFDLIKESKIKFKLKVKEIISTCVRDSSTFKKENGKEYTVYKIETVLKTEDGTLKDICLWHRFTDFEILKTKVENEFKNYTELKSINENFPIKPWITIYQYTTSYISERTKKFDEWLDKMVKFCQFKVGIREIILNFLMEGEVDQSIEYSIKVNQENTYRFKIDVDNTVNFFENPLEKAKSLNKWYNLVRYQVLLAQKLNTSDLLQGAWSYGKPFRILIDNGKGDLLRFCEFENEKDCLELFYSLKKLLYVSFKLQDQEIIIFLEDIVNLIHKNIVEINSTNGFNLSEMIQYFSSIKIFLFNNKKVFVDPTLKHPSLVCAICKEICNDPVMSSDPNDVKCYCMICLKIHQLTSLKNKDKNTQIFLHNNFEFKEISQIMKKDYNMLLVQCPFRSYGCKENIKVSEFEIHLVCCKFELYKCPNSKICQFESKSKIDLFFHIKICKNQFLQECPHNIYLPKNTYIYIFSFLSYKDVLNFSRTCKFMYNFVQKDEKIWRNFCTQNDVIIKQKDVDYKSVFLKRLEICKICCTSHLGDKIVNNNYVKSLPYYHPGLINGKDWRNIVKEQKNLSHHLNFLNLNQINNFPTQFTNYYGKKFLNGFTKLCFEVMRLGYKEEDFLINTLEFIPLEEIDFPTKKQFLAFLRTLENWIRPEIQEFSVKSEWTCCKGSYYSTPCSKKCGQLN